MAKKKSSSKLTKSVQAAPIGAAEESALDVATPLLTTVQIIDVMLVSSRVLISGSAVDPDSCVNLKMKTHVAKYGIVDGQSRFWVVIPFALIAQKDDESEPIFTIEASFKLIYHTSALEAMTPVALEAFAKTNAIYNAWPYWREYTQNMTMRMGVPPVTLPVFRL